MQSFVADGVVGKLTGKLCDARFVQSSSMRQTAEQDKKLRAFWKASSCVSLHRPTQVLAYLHVELPGTSTQCSRTGLRWKREHSNRQERRHYQEHAEGRCGKGTSSCRTRDCCCSRSSATAWLKALYGSLLASDRYG